MIDITHSEMEKEKKAFPNILDTMPKYPMGTKICLDSDTLKKLGVTSPPKVGDKFEMESILEVVAVNTEKNRDDQGSFRVDYQITMMSIDTGDVEEDGRVKALYGE